MRTERTTARGIKQIREQIAYEFELEGVRLGFAVVRSLTNFRYVVRDTQQQQEYLAMVLPTSFDFYEYRLNCHKRRVSLLIVARHNAVVPVSVLSLEQVSFHEPLHVPQISREGRKRRNHEEVMLLLSKLLLNFESAYEELATMSDRARKRYLDLKQVYLTPRIGRPWAS